ncbi:glyoxylate/hydroxypyruvate reductase A (plasmid) [Paroceanicella profunda]|uniref:Glyoxylate/hydroxypyruvate reductase A n=1 Tax=Paroceanicella profunda TaxID=2579971 RepID=A0A5B8G659_9RHOB|nr:glyoxylate/hydroxypyruvate reductase A [Paroceanicella profunda]QDL94573.1 glyoxylate/hydroxypyruvate reductase A [Paroceanicella profunda]
MSIVVHCPDPAETAEWRDRLAALMPEARVEALEAAAAPEAVRYAVVWQPGTGRLARFPGLRAIVSLGAGIDHVLADRALPAHVPIIRTVGRDLTQRMREYVALHVLRHHREMPALAAAQAAARWQQIVPPPATGRRVGVMGLGNLGAAAARSLAALGFDTAGWARSAREIEGVACFAGAGELGAFLARSEILVCLLPLTDATADILNAGLFARLPHGASLVNAGRGGHLVEEDLLAALDSGRISHATLDVFRQEPLPAGHPFWRHPGVTVTPHIASMIDPETGGRIVAANIRAFERDGTVADLADAARGY